MSLVIAAIPEEGDRVYNVSSEKVPHCTLLFLGDGAGADVQEIARFLEHAINTTEMGPFGLEVDHRGTLGPDEADVLFFIKRWSGKRLADLRGQLLQNRAIRDAYDSAEQFGTVEEWTPHLTLGYPRAPARKDDRDYPIGYVQFDRIALWTGDYSGPEFRLEYNYNEEFGELAMSVQAERGRDFLEHYGVKGMRWGQRNSSTPASEVTTTSVVNAGLRKKTKIKAKGGDSHPAAADAVKAATQKQKLKKSGTAALSNKELQELATRLNLEKQVSQLAASPGKAYVQKTLKTQGNQQFQGAVNQKVSEGVQGVMNKKRN